MREHVDGGFGKQKNVLLGWKTAAQRSAGGCFDHVCVCLCVIVCFFLMPMTVCTGSFFLRLDRSTAVTATESMLLLFSLRGGERPRHVLSIGACFRQRCLVDDVSRAASLSHLQ